VSTSHIIAYKNFRTFQDIAPKFAGLSRIKPISRTFQGLEILQKNLRLSRRRQNPV